MSQKIHPLSLRTNRLSRRNISWFRERKPSFLLKRQLLLRSWYNILFSQIMVPNLANRKTNFLKSNKTVGVPTKKEQNTLYFTPNMFTRISRNKIYVSPLFCPATQKVHIQKYLPLSSKGKKGKRSFFNNYL